MMHFDVLPIHPQPQWLESYTGYLTRIAENMGFSSVNSLTSLFFPHTPARTIRKITDFGITYHSELAVCAAINDGAVQALTLKHLCMKFGRSHNPQAMSRFLSNSLNPFLRWCPECLREQPPYYRLIWRFSCLAGCGKHKCRLQEVCPYCNNHIQLFHAPFAIGLCSHCGYRLCDGKSLQPIEGDINCVTECESDLIFLVSSQELELDPSSIIRRVGKLMQMHRLDQRLSLPQIAQYTNCKLSALECVEYAGFSTRGAGFDVYYKYSQILGIRLSSLFNEAVASLESQTVISFSREDSLLKKVKSAINQMYLYDKRLSQRTLAAFMGVSRSHLTKYPSVVAEIKKHTLN